MAEQQILIYDIISEHRDRMENLKKYYPFFRLQDVQLSQFKDGSYAAVDMGYVTMAVLRYFIEENNFNDKDVFYEDYESFMYELLERDFDIFGKPDEKEFIQYLFDKICNDGKPFYYNYFDPDKKLSHKGRVRLIESRYKDGIISYHISSDAIEFYLDTKETKDESIISVQQLLLEKMIRSKNFKGGVDVIRRINSEVSRMMMKKDEIVTLLGRNIFEGIRELEEFSEKGMKWFDEEQRLFDSNLELVRKALNTAQENGSHSAEEIYLLNRELKKAMDKHAKLLSACTQLQIQSDEMVLKAKRTRFRQTMDFTDLLSKAVMKDDVRILEAMVSPLFHLNIHKTFSMFRLEDMLSYRPEEKESGETLTTAQEETYIYEDEVEDERIRHNGELLIKGLFDTLLAKKSFTLKELNHLYVMKFTDNLLKNGDYFAFLAHLSQKSEYRLDKIKEQPDTFLEEMMVQVLNNDREKEYEGMWFTLEFIPEEKITLNGTDYITDIRFERRGI